LSNPLTNIRRRRNLTNDANRCVSNAYNIPKGRVYIAKFREPRTETSGGPDKKFEYQIKYHDQILCGGVVPDLTKQVSKNK